MNRGFTTLRARAFGATALAMSALCAGAAMADADLIINRDDSTVNFGGCALNEPLASGRIVIRNDGDSRATMKLGIVTRFTRSLLSVYEPEHPDMVDNGKERTALDSKDQESVAFEIGKGVVKKGRFVSASTSETMLDVEALSSDDKKDIQRALQAIGLYKGGIDGVFGGGYRRAVTAFQKMLGDDQTGALTVAETAELARKSGTPLTLGSASAGGGATTTIPVVIYAVVDPFNLVEESNEANNIEKFRGEISCN